MNRHDDAFSESIAVFALGALPESEASAVAAHVRTCAECRAEYDDLRGVADLVGYQAESSRSELDELAAARMKLRIMRVVRADAEAPAPAGIPTVERVAASKRPWFAYGLAAAAVLVAAFVSVDDVGLRSHDASQTQNVATANDRAAQLAAASAAAETQRRSLERELALVVAPGSKHFAVPRGEVIESNGRLVIALTGVAAPPNGKTYQAWTLARGAKSVAPSITFAPDASGRAVVELPESAAGIAAVAVSVEPAGGSKAPTSKADFVRALT